MQEPCSRNRHQQKHRNHGKSGEGREIARCKRSMALARMTAVGLNVQQIVHNVSRRSGEREAAEGRQRRQKFGRGERMRTEQRDKDQQVLGPLVNAHGLHQGPHRMPPLHKLARRLDAASAKPHPQPHGRIGDHRLLRLRQQRQVGRIVADVIECSWAKAGAQPVQLLRAGQVGCAVRTQHSCKNAEVRRDAVGQAHIRASGQKDRPSLCALLLKILEQRPVVGQVRHVELN